MLLKVFQQMHHFPSLDNIPVAVVEHVRAAANIGPAVRFGYDTQASPTLFRHYAEVREHLGVKPYYGTDAGTIATRSAHTAALSMDQPVDIINATIDELIAQDIELPAFSTLDRTTEQIHAKTRVRLFRRVARRLTDEQKNNLDRLPARDLSSRQTAYNRIKRHARRPSRQHLDLLIDHRSPGSTRSGTSPSRSPASRHQSCAHWPCRRWHSTRPPSGKTLAALGTQKMFVAGIAAPVATVHRE